MPQPFKPTKGGVVITSHRVLEERPDCAVQIALIASAWTRVENELVTMFSHVTGTAEKIMEGAWHVTANDMAWTILRAIENLHLRLTVVKAATQEILPPHLKEEFESLAAELRARAGERNTVVHGTWAITDAYPKDVLLRIHSARAMPKWIRYTEKDLRLIADRIFLAATSVAEFSGKHLKHKHP